MTPGPPSPRRLLAGQSLAASPVDRPAPAPRPPAATRSSSRLAVRPSARPATPIATDYRYVLSDLKRIGVLAALAFALLGTLSFVIR
ncbi:MAG: hypothetical protein HYY04_14100 [Chloroflexi bacterium]|nr:hypothetical protein [Chloroflexota bacterium]